MVGFENEVNVKLSKRMRPVAKVTYGNIWRGCDIRYIPDSSKVNSKYAIDLIVTLNSGQPIYIQEKIRTPYSLPDKDFLFEYKNADGLPNESGGEYFNIAAQMFFEGWHAPDEKSFVAWILFDVLMIKIIIDGYGGIENVPEVKKHYNHIHGRSSFHNIKWWVLKDAIISSFGIDKADFVMPENICYVPF